MEQNAWNEIRGTADSSAPSEHIDAVASELVSSDWLKRLYSSSPDIVNESNIYEPTLPEGNGTHAASYRIFQSKFLELG